MSLAIAYSRAYEGVQAPLVCVEVHLANGLPGLSIVGLPETAVKESKDRVRGALINSQFEFPARRITINLAPADLPKDGGRFDLAIALGVLAASGQIPQQPLEQYEFVGELALSGNLRPIRGVLPVALATRDAGRELICPLENADEAALVSDLVILGSDHLNQVCAHLARRQQIQRHRPRAHSKCNGSGNDMADVSGQPLAKRALEIAAAGNHNLIMAGPPGTGKTMLASRLPGILPNMTEHEALESAAIRSISLQGLKPKSWGQRPFRAPHHTASGAALVGGGSVPRPGEISLAHHGVMFLDELPEFGRKALEVLREPIESGRIVISRAARQAEFPARFQLIAAMNPCPCGYLGDSEGRCRCTPTQIRRYRTRISGPLLDRFDLQIVVPRLATKTLRPERRTRAEPSNAIQARVVAARQRQQQRAQCANAQMDTRQVGLYCRLQTQDYQFLEKAMEKLGLSARAYHRILKVARTIADLQGEEHIGVKHLSEALSYRQLEKQHQQLL